MFAKLSQRPPAESLKTALNRILETGCVIKDLDVGLLDFPAVIDNEDVYLCWKLGEDRIRFYHRQDEGFARAANWLYEGMSTRAASITGVMQVVDCRRL